MVQGVSSWAGKSLLTTALVRFFARRGVRVAPFEGHDGGHHPGPNAGRFEAASVALCTLLARGLLPVGSTGCR